MLSALAYAVCDGLVDLHSEVFALPAEAAPPITRSSGKVAARLNAGRANRNSRRILTATCALLSRQVNGFGGNAVAIRF